MKFAKWFLTVACIVLSVSAFSKKDILILRATVYNVSDTEQPVAPELFTFSNPGMFASVYHAGGSLDNYPWSEDTDQALADGMPVDWATSDAGYDSCLSDMSQYDVLVLGKVSVDNTEMLETHNTVTWPRDLKEANPNISLVFYNNIVACSGYDVPYWDNGGTWEMYTDLNWYQKMWLALDKPVYETYDGGPLADGWLRSITGLEITDTPYGNAYTGNDSTSFNNRLFRMHPSVADTVSHYILKMWENSQTQLDGVGPYFDFISSAYPDWMCIHGGCDSQVDLDLDGVAYGSDADELDLFMAYQDSVVQKVERGLRQMKGEKNFLLVANGYNAVSTRYAPYLDGYYRERYTEYQSYTQSGWLEQANEHIDRFTTGRVTTPIIMWEGVLHGPGPEYAPLQPYEIAMSNIALANICGGLGGIMGTNMYQRSSVRGAVKMVDFPHIGVSTGLATIDADTLSRTFSTGEIRVIVPTGGTTRDGPWDCIVFGETTDDTLYREGWPRKFTVAAMPLAAYHSLDQESDYRDTGYTDYQLDLMASNDFNIIMPWIINPSNTETDTVSATVYAKNPDSVILMYTSIFGMATYLENSNLVYHEARVWDMVDDFGGWAKDLNGDYMYNSSGNARYMNLSAPDGGRPDASSFPDSLARIYVDAMSLVENGQTPNLGLFIDWFDDYKWPGWALNDTLLDLDQNGIPHVYDIPEQEAYVENNSQFLQALRAEIQAQLVGDRVVILNGGGVENQIAYYPYVDGTMFEKLNTMGLTSQSQWEAAAASNDRFYKGNYLSAVSMAHATDDSSFYRMEAISLLLGMNGTVMPNDHPGEHIANGQFDGRLSWRDEPLAMGAATSDLEYIYSAAENDTIRRGYKNGLVEINFNGTAGTRWASLEYLIRNSNEEVISRYGYANNELEDSWDIIGSTCWYPGVVGDFTFTAGQLGIVGSAATRIQYVEGNEYKSIRTPTGLSIKASTAVLSMRIKNIDMADGLKASMVLRDANLHRLNYMWSNGEVVLQSAPELIDDYGFIDMGNGWWKVWLMVDLTSQGIYGNIFQTYLYPFNTTAFTDGAGCLIDGFKVEYDVLTPGPYMKKTCE